MTQNRPLRGSRAARPAILLGLAAFFGASFPVQAAPAPAARYSFSALDADDCNVDGANPVGALTAGPGASFTA